jgi:glycosyltransferase involved in cell wall biosynthesis
LNDALRVALITEQLMQEGSGSVGTYIRSLLRRLPLEGVELDPVVAFHRSSALADAGLPHARRLAVGRSQLQRRWARGRGPGATEDVALVHAPTLSFPPQMGKPLVVTVHDLVFLDHRDAFGAQAVAYQQAMLERLGDADLVIVPSQATADALAATEYAHDRVRVVPMGTDITPPDEAERAKTLERLRVEKPYVLWIGTLDPWRNPEGVVRGFVEAIDAGVPGADELHLYLAGPRGWWSAELAEFISSRNLSDRVRRIDEQPASVRGALYAEAAAFVFPSFVEGSGQPVLEAMACGAPVVTSNTSALPEVVGSAAQLCDPNDNAAIGAAIGKVLRDTELAEDLRRLGRKRASEFTWERTARETLRSYQEVLAPVAIGAPAD